MSENIYSLPVREESILPKSRENGGLSFNSHAGNLCYALDFLVPESTPIYAAAEGIVVFVKQDSNVGGPDPKYWNDGNRIVVRHKNGEYTAYEHLRYMGSRVYTGQFVKRSQLIGYSGSTGCSSCPHLHFEVFIDPCDDESEGKTVEINFSSHRFNYEETITAEIL